MGPSLQRQTDKQKEITVRQAGWGTSHPPPLPQLQGSIIDSYLLIEPKICSPGSSGHRRCCTRPVLCHPSSCPEQHNAFHMLTDLPNPAHHLSTSSRALLHLATPQREAQHLSSHLHYPSQHPFHFSHPIRAAAIGAVQLPGLLQCLCSVLSCIAS